MSLARLRSLYREYPAAFWMLTTVMFIDAVGGGLLYPFYALYVTQRFGVGMTSVGLLFTLSAAAGFAGSLVGGGLTDRLGRKGMILLSLVTSAGSALVMGLVDELRVFFGLALLVGFLTDVGRPAYQAMVADLLPAGQQAQGYAILRVVVNLSMVIGPAIGGFLITRSFLLLFFTDAVISLISAGVVLAAIPETLPKTFPGAPRPNLRATYRGYSKVLGDRFFVIFILIGTLIILAYTNLNTTLGVYLRDVHGVPEAGYAWLLSMNAAMVVLFQFSISRRLQKRDALLVMSAGSLLMAAGFGLFGAGGGYPLFVAAMALVTLGEMLVVPTSQARAARFAPEDMRGRYMAIYGFMWTAPFIVGPLASGYLMDNADPRWLWAAAALAGSLAAAGFVALQRRLALEPVE